MSVTATCLVEAIYAGSTDTTLYTTPVNTRTIIDKFTATNTDVGPQTITVHLVKSGDTPAATNQIVISQSLAAGAVYDFVEIKNHILNAGDYLSVVASAGSVLITRASGRECT